MESKRTPFTIESASAPFPFGYFLPLKALPGIRHGVSTRTGPLFGTDARAEQCSLAARQLASEAGLDDTAWCHQVHGAEVRYVDQPGLAGTADGLITDRTGLGVLGRSADCPLVLAAGPRRAGNPRHSRQVVGMAHASWRSTVAGISERMLSRLISDCGADPDATVVCVCPSAGPCCYEVGPEVRAAALDNLGRQSGEFFHARQDRYLLDLWAANRAQIIRTGIRPENIHLANLCTICRNDLFPSYRIEGANADRFGAIIGWTSRSGRAGRAV